MSQELLRLFTQVTSDQNQTNFFLSSQNLNYVLRSQKILAYLT